MSWATWKKRLGLDGHTHTGHFVAPTFALDVEPGFVAAARLSPSKRQVQSVGVHELPPGALAPSASKSNVTDVAVVRRSIAAVSEKVGNGGGRVGLLIPDAAARVALLQFETLPDKHREAETLVVWRMREFLPYPPEEAHLTFQVVGKQPGVVEVLAVAVRGSVLAEYEMGLEGINGGPALVLPASVALLPLLPEGTGGQLLLHLCPGALTAVVVASNRLRYWRTRPLEGDTQGNLAEVAREATRVLATCQDNLSVQVQNVWYCERTPAEAKPPVAEVLAKALGHELRSLPGNFVPAAGLPRGQREIFERFGMPFAGLVANLS
jgi:type IV pilus assembly protein PilM